MNGQESSPAERAHRVLRSEKAIEVLRQLSIADDNLYFGEIQEATGMKIPTLSGVLSTLIEAGLVHTDMPGNARVRGRAARYSADPAATRRMCDELADYLTGQ